MNTGRAIAWSRNQLVENYSQLFLKYGDTPEAVQSSPEGQQFRHDKLLELADLRGKRVLDLGCGLGHFYPRIVQQFGAVDYTGIDIVPETIAYAARKYPEATFLCRDILAQGMDDLPAFDYGLISAVFNNAMADATEFLKQIVATVFERCSCGLGFNFISTVVNYTDPELAYHDPLEVLGFCLKELSPKTVMQHHYQRCDVVVFVYR
jgi:SAM-dependent methyltransferase